MGADHPPYRIVVTSIGGAPGFDLARMLMQAGHPVIGVDTHPDAAGLFLPDVTPRVIASTSDDRYDTDILLLCRELHPDALIPASEAEVARLIALQPQLADLGVRTWLPLQETITACLDKAVFHQAMRTYDIATPQTWLPEELDTVPDGIELIVKPRRGHGAKDVLFCRTVKQARVLCELIPDPLVQQRITGREFTADCLVDRDGHVSVIPRFRRVVRNGLSMSAATFHDDGVAERVTTALCAVGATGICNAQGFVTDTDDRVVMTEINARIAGAFPISVAAGADLIGQLLNGLFGHPVDHARLRHRSGVHLVKYVETLALGIPPLTAARDAGSPVPDAAFSAAVGGR